MAIMSGGVKVGTPIRNDVNKKFQLFQTSIERPKIFKTTSFDKFTFMRMGDETLHFYTSPEQEWSQR